jgi:hypothetical protein
METKGPSKDIQPPKNSSKSQMKKVNGETKKDTGKWCDFHKKTPGTTLMNVAKISH